jgi:predicted Rdx family selenoprotein
MEKKFYTLKTQLSRAEVGVYFAAVQRMQQDLEDAILRGKEDKGFPEAKEVIDRIRSL